MSGKNKFLAKFSKILFDQRFIIDVVRSDFNLNISRKQFSFWCLEHYSKEIDNCTISGIKKIKTKEDVIKFAKKYPKIWVSCNFGPIHKGDFVFDKSTN